MKRILLLLLITVVSSINLRAQWIAAGPKDSGNGNLIVENGTLYFWNAAGGFQYSTDNGATWITPPNTFEQYTSLSLANAAGERLYAVLRSGGGGPTTAMPLYTVDRGSTWRADTLGAVRYGASGLPVNVGALYAWGHWLYAEWDDMEPFYRIKTFEGPFTPSAFIRAKQPTGMVAKGDTLFNLSADTLHYTTDGGVTWITPANNGFSVYFGIMLMVDGARLYCLASKEWQAPYSLFYTDDNGENWTEIDITSATNKPNPQSGGYYDPSACFIKGNLIELALEQEPGVEIANVWRSTDLGATWSRDADGMPAWTVHSLVCGNDGNLWAVTDPGIRTRKIVKILAAPRLISPQQGEEIGPDHVFTWGPVDNAVRYHLQIALDPEFATIIMERIDLTDTSLDVPWLPSANWYWRVRGVNVRDEPGPWSDVGRFSVSEASVAAVPGERRFSVHPNPSHNRFTVELPEGKYASLELRDLLGRVIRTERQLTGRTSLVVEVTGLAPGRYWLVLKGTTGTDASSIVVE